MKLLEHNMWDTHVHLFNPERFPWRNDRKYTPGPAYVHDLLQGSPGRNFLVVQASIEEGYESVLTHVQELARECPGQCFRAAIIWDGDAEEDHWDEQKLSELHNRGVRCLRYRNTVGFGSSPDLIKNLLLGRLGSVARSMGWSIAMQLPLQSWAGLSECITHEMAGVPIIAEHCASIHAPSSPSDADAFKAVLVMVRSGALYVKLGALHRRAAVGADATELDSMIHALSVAGSSNILWGSDWPHVDSTPLGLEESPHLRVDAAAELKRIRECISSDAFEAMVGATPAALFQ